MPTYYSRSPKPIDIPLFNFNRDIFCNLALSLFSYVNQFALLTIIKALPNTNRLGLSSIMVRSHYFPMFIYVLITFAGGVSFGTDVNYFVILRDALPGQSDVMMILAQFGVFAVILFSIIIKVKCNGELFVSLMGFLNIIKLNILNQPNKYIKYLVNAVLAFSAMGLSFLIKDNVLDVISLFSSVTCPYYIFIAPCKLYIRILKRRFVEY